jgi:hypothetical protein
MQNFSPFFPAPESGISYTVAGIKPKTSNTTFYQSNDVYDTESLALDRSFNLGCLGYRRVLVSSQGTYKYSPCSDVEVYKSLMKLMPKIPVERRYYEFDPTENIYDVRDSINDNLYTGFEYKEQILKRSLSNVIFKDPIKDGILQYYNKVVFGLIETTKQIRNYVNYTVKKNNRRVF